MYEKMRESFARLELKATEMRFLRPIPEPQVTEPELLQENKNDIVGNKSYIVEI